MGRHNDNVGRGDFDQLVRTYINSSVAKYIDFLEKYDGLLVSSVSVTAYGTVRDPGLMQGFFQRMFGKSKPFTPTQMYAVSSFRTSGHEFSWSYRDIMDYVRHSVPYFGDCHMLSITVRLERTSKTHGDYQDIRRPLVIEMKIYSNVTQGIHGLDLLWEYRDVKDHRVPKSNANVNVGFSLDEPAESFKQFKKAA